MTRLSDALDAGEFVVIGELRPPVGINCIEMQRTIETLGPLCTALNVPDNQSAGLRLSSLAASKLVLDAGFEPIFQQNCRDRNRLALQADLLAAWSFGLRNLLVVTGDDPRRGDHVGAKGVFDLDSTQWLMATVGLNHGRAMNNAALDGSPDFYLGAACFPEAEPWRLQRMRTWQKVQAGAQFFETQVVMDIDKFAERITELKETGAKIIASVLLFKSLGVIDFINRSIAGIQVPDHVTRRIAAASDPREEAVALAIEQIEVLKEVADGIHILPIGEAGLVKRILEETGLA